MEELFERFEFNEATDFVIEAVNGVRLPAEYLEFMHRHDGGEGDFGKNAYIQLFRLEELEEVNTEYGIPEYLAGWAAWGTDLGGNLFVYSEKENTYAAADACSLGEDDLMYREDSWQGFLQRWDRELGD